MFAYRPDIDTLRAVAVLSVVVFHFERAWLPGGFLGVDIFFVISGFLITSIIHREMKDGTFSFKSFYIRRIKRILPAFFAVVFVTLLVAAFFYSPDDYKFLGRSAFASVLFAANLYFARGQGYFDPAQEEKPLLHIWSLSVEEQYYFLFPLLCLWLVKQGWRRQFVCLAVLIVASAGAALLPAFGLDKYYLPHLRAGEMLIGSLAAVWMQYCRLKNSFPAERFAAPASLVSAVVLTACLVFYRPEMPFFPGVAALLPCFAAAALIYFNGFDHRFKKLFALKWVVFVGLSSYSLYLWHWPVLAFARFWLGEPELPLTWMLPLALVVVSLSLLSYYLVEQPCRKIKPAFGRNAVLLYVLPAAAVAVCWQILMQSPLIEKYRIGGLARDYSSCHNNFDKRCIWGAENRKPTVLMLGDSHADHYKTFVDTVGKSENWAATLVSADTCAYAEGYRSRLFDSSSACRAVHEYARTHLQEYPVVFLAMRWGNQMDSQSIAYDPQFFTKFDATLARLSKEKQAVYLFTDTPTLTRHGLRSYKLSQVFGHPQPAFTPDETHRNVLLGNRKMKETAARYPNVHIVDTASLMPAGFEYGGKPLLSDADHINPYGGRVLADKFLQKHILLKGSAAAATVRPNP